MRSRRQRLEDDFREATASPNGHVPLIRRASEVEPEAIDWIWPGRLARGKIALLEGDPGLGKSTITIEIAARLSTGTVLPSGWQIPPLGTLFLSAEDGVADTIVPRLIAAGADRARIIVLEGVVNGDGEEEGVAVPRDLPLIAQIMLDNDCGLVVLDPLSVFLGDDINENKNQEVRKALAPAKAMLEQSRVAGLFLRHLTKSQSASPVYRGAGSIGLGGAARIVMMVGDHPDQEGVKVLANVKENLSAPTPSLTYKVVPNPDNPRVGQIEWVGVTTLKARDIQMPTDTEEGDRIKECKIWLVDYLKDLKGGATAKAVRTEADKAGHAWRTVERAKKILKIKSVKNYGDGSWVWKMPIGWSEDVESADDDNTANKSARGDDGVVSRAYHGDGGLDGQEETPTKNNNINTDYVDGVVGGVQDRHGGDVTYGNAVNNANNANTIEGRPPPW